MDLSGIETLTIRSLLCKSLAFAMLSCDGVEKIQLQASLCHAEGPHLMSYLSAVRAGEVKLDVCAVGLQDIPSAVLREGQIRHGVYCPCKANVCMDQESCSS